MSDLHRVTITATLTLLAGSAAAQPINNTFAFPTYPISRTPTNATTMVHGDFNADGFVDVAWISDPVESGAADAGTSVTVALGEGNGNFTEVAVIATTASELVAADLDNDGADDLLTNDSGVRFFRSAGNGLFEPGLQVLIADAPTSLIATDLNDDGRPEILFDQGILRNEYPSFVQTAEPIPPVAHPRFTPFAFDINKDGTPDLIYDAGPALGLQIHTPELAIASRTDLPVYFRPDLLDHPFDKFLAFRPTPQSDSIHLATSRPDLTTGFVYDLTFAMNGDTPEIATQTRGLERTLSLSSFLPMNEVTVLYRDMDADGYLDRFDQTSGRAKYRAIVNKINTGFRYPVPQSLRLPDPNERAKLEVIGERQLYLDVNQDQIPDIVRPGVVLLSTRTISSPDPQFGPAEFFTTPRKSFATADFNGDGHPDLASIEPGFKIALGGSGVPGLNFSSVTIEEGSPGPGLGNVTVGDINADGLTDLIVANASTELVTVVTNRGGLTFSVAPIFFDFPFSFAQLLPTLGDLDGDGDPDLVLTLNINIAFEGDPIDRVLVLRNDAGVFTPVSDITLEGDTKRFSAVVIDADGDGIADILIPEGEAGTIRVLPGLGGLSFGEATTFTRIADTANLSVIDLDNDGTPELLVSGNASSTLKRRRMRCASSGETQPACCAWTSRAKH